jgi:hypothetical protein
VSTWPPTPEEVYLDDNAGRPVFQGDIFREVPFVKVQAGDTPAADPRTRVERRYVATILHPCDMYAEASGALAKVQAVALVRTAQGTRIPDDWGGAFSVCPLPNLLGDDAMWLADFRATSNVDRSFLREDNRERSLTEFGWAVFRQRLAAASTRLMISLDDLQGVGATTWRETLLWQQWNSAGRETTEFHPWYDTADPNLGGLTRRTAVERGMYDQVRFSLVRELHAA